MKYYEEFKKFTVVKDRKGNIINFEPGFGFDLSEILRAIKKFLKQNNIDKTYILKFNHSKISINKDSNVAELANGYFNGYFKENRTINNL